MKDIAHAFAPNKVVSRQAMQLLIAMQAATVLLLWAFSPFVFLPAPGETWRAFEQLWAEGFAVELGTSFYLNVQAILLASLISLGLAYLTVLPFFRPVVAVLSKLRFLSLVGLSFFFTLMARNGHALKLYLLVFSVSVFFVTSMADVLVSIPKEKFDLGRTLRMGEWRVVGEVVILGQADKVFDVLRQNSAISWMMLTMVETMSREGGGIGGRLVDNNRRLHLDAVLAIQLTVLALGLVQDYGIGLVKKMVCPYADLTLERR